MPTLHRARVPLAAAILLAAAIATPTPAAADGAATLTFKSKPLRAHALSVKASVPAKARGRKVTLPATRVSVGAIATVRLGGALRVTAHGRSTRLTGLRVTVSGSRVSLSALVGARRVTVLQAALRRGRAKLNRSGVSVSLASTPVKLTSRGASALRSRLRARTLPRAAVATLLVNARQQQPPSYGTTVPASGGPAAAAATPTPGPTDPDPDLGPCPVVAGPGAPGSDTSAPDPRAPAAAPALTDPLASSGGAIDWGFRGSFRTYVNAGGGAPPTPPISTLDGASANEDGSFRFTPTAGQVERGRSALADRLVLAGTGTVMFCYPKHFFRITLANPTVTIDGASSRIALDVAVNSHGRDLGTHRVDFAALDLAGIRPSYGADGKQQTWRAVPAKLTADGASAFAGFLQAGAQLDPITITTAIDTVPDPFAAACAIAPGTSPFPPGPAPADPAALPSLTDPLAITAGAADWGFKASFRGYVFGGGGSPTQGTPGVSVLPPATLTGLAPVPTSFFRFPATTGSYSAGAPADPADDRLILSAQGIALFCHPTHGFRIALGNPTVVLDGAASRIVADVDLNAAGTIHPSTRADIAKLDLTAITPTTSPDGKTLTWSSIPATLTADGASAFSGFYAAGTALDAVTVSATLP